jgi:hypothetical protein
METSWLTYREAADALGLPSPAAAKLRAKRGRWPKRQGNDGLVRVEIPEGTTPHRPHIDPASPKADDPASTPDRSQIDTALQALREQLKAAGEREQRLTADLATERAAFATDKAALGSDLAAERARADRAIRAFECLAERLEAMAAARRPWWRRLVG